MRRSVVALILVGSAFASIIRSRMRRTMPRLCSLMSVSANSTSRNSGTQRMSVTSFFVNPTLPAPMIAIFKPPRLPRITSG